MTCGLGDALAPGDRLHPVKMKQTRGERLSEDGSSGGLAVAPPRRAPELLISARWWSVPSNFPGNFPTIGRKETDGEWSSLCVGVCGSRCAGEGETCCCTSVCKTKRRKEIIIAQLCGSIIRLVTTENYDQRCPWEFLKIYLDPRYVLWTRGILCVPTRRELPQVSLNQLCHDRKIRWNIYEAI